jgi:hypothetical protein
MKRRIYAGAAVSTLFLAACLVAPTEPGGTPLSGCAPGEHAFNGECRKECADTASCPAGLSCMNVGGASALCLDYDHCGYVGNDTECSSGGSYGPSDPYWTPEPEPSYGNTSYSPYGGGDCSGNAKWQVETPSTDPRCGQSHSVVRCERRGARCELVQGTTLDVADP